MKTRPGSAVYNPPGTAGGTPDMWDSGITSLTDLAAVVTTTLAVGTIRAWIMAEDGTEQVWKLIAGTMATSDGIQRPTDYNASTNAKVWVKASS
jgi:hypothetical protein